MTYYGKTTREEVWDMGKFVTLLNESNGLYFKFSTANR